MEVFGITRTIERIKTAVPRTVYRYSIDPIEVDYLNENADETATLIDSFPLEALLSQCTDNQDLKSLFLDPSRRYLQCGGWQSWSAGWELLGKEKLPGRVLLIPDLIKFTNRDADSPGKNEAVGHFIMYYRVDDYYLVLASIDGGLLPPLSWRINRLDGTVSAEVYSCGKKWVEDDAVAELHLFMAKGYFEFKDTLARIYQSQERFASISFLRTRQRKPFSAKHALNKDNMPGGFESWYNHYTDIHEDLILEDLAALDKSDNLIKLRYIDRDRPVVFQIDDGWEQAVGDWTVDRTRFPRGLAPVAREIEARGYIPGLWLAPFLITRKARFFTEKKEWLLRDKSGKPVVAGFNDRWDNYFYALDLSRQDVRDYLRELMDTVIDEWGFRYLKLDFMYAGLLSGAYQAGTAAYDHYESACRILTARKKDAQGNPVAYLGCGVPFGASYTHFPLSRIGADTRESWDWFKVKMIRHVGRPSAYISLMDTIGRSYMDNTIFINDPDVVFLRSTNCKLKEHEKELIAMVNYLLAGQLMFSDDPAHITHEDILLTSRIVSLYERLASDEYGAVRIDRDVFSLISRSGAVFGLINLRRAPYSIGPHNKADLFEAFTHAESLLNNAVLRSGSLVFKGRSISIYTNKD